MNATKGLGLLILAGGVFALAYGGFSYTKETHEAKIGSIDLSLKEKQPVNIPVWAGVLAVVLGAGMLLVPAKK